MRRWGPLRKEGELEVVDDPIHHGIIRNKSDDLHLAAALRADEGINFIHFADHLGPALGGDSPELLPHPLAPLLQPLGMAGGAEATGAAGKHKEVFSPTVGTADAGKPAARIAAVQVALHNLLDNGTEEAVLFLEAMLIFCEEAVEVMKKHSVKGGPLRMSGTINSGHSRSFSSRNGPARSKHALCSLYAWKMRPKTPPYCSGE